METRIITSLVGKTFGDLTVVSFAGKTDRLIWNCRCVCGSIHVTTGDNLRSGHTKSCGCRRKGRSGNRKHGYYRHPEYESYRLAKRRCQDEGSPTYKKYGANGVEFRFTSFDQFLAEVGRRPSAKHTIDRIENNGHYEPGNVRWATATEQSNNRRSSIRVTIDGVTKTVSEWCGGSQTVKASKCYRRIRSGWCPVCAIKTPLNQKKHIRCDCLEKEGR
jgi:hypothetical protein